MTTGACPWSSVLSISSSSPTPCSSRGIGSRQHGDTHATNTGTSWTTSWLGSVTRGTYYTPEWCPVQTATLVIGWYVAKSPLPSSHLPRGKVPRLRKLQVHKLCDPKVKSNLQVMLEEILHCVTAAEPEEQCKQMKTILQETTAEVVDLYTASPHGSGC